MYLHGPRLLADRIASASGVRYTRTLERGMRSAAARPGDTRWQATTASARKGVILGFAVGAHAVDGLPLQTSIFHAIDPSTRGYFGYTRLPWGTSRVPTAAAVLFAKLAIGNGKERVGINLAESKTDIATNVLRQYGALGFAEFGLSLAASRLHAKGHSVAASACRFGAYVVAMVLEAPRLALAVFLAFAQFAGALAGGALGAIVGAVVGASRQPPPAAYGTAEAAPNTAGVCPPGRAVARPDLMKYLATQPSAVALREALADCCRDDATFAANAAALDTLADRVDSGSRAIWTKVRKAALKGETFHLELLELAVGPLTDPDAFAAAYRPRSLRLHPDRLTALQLGERSRELARKAWNVLSVANDLARSMREGANDARVLAQEAPQRAF